LSILHQILDSVKEDCVISEARRGIRCSAVMSRYCGLASTMMKECGGAEADFSGNLAGASALETASLLLSENIPAAAVGMASLNSLIGTGGMKLENINASEIITKAGRGGNVSVIGHFPFTEDLKKSVKNFWTIEQRPRPGDHSENEAEKFLPVSDVIAISATALINHTIEGLLSLCTEKSMKILLGPSAPFSEVLFDFGFDYICGAAVRDKERLFQLLSEGASFRQLKNAGSMELLTASKKENR